MLSSFINEMDHLRGLGYPLRQVYLPSKNP